MPLLVADQRSPGWYSARQGRITASLAAACLGKCPHSSSAKAWRTIMGTEPDRDNRHMAWGREFEEAARQSYEVETGNLVAPAGFWVHRVYDFLGASPDGFCGSDGLLEVKVPGKLPEAIPEHHKIQMMVQMAVTDRSWCDYYVWVHRGYEEPGTFLCRLHRDLEAEGALIAELDEWRVKYILGNVEPPRKARKKKEVAL